jgi:hypothetical protein
MDSYSADDALLWPHFPNGNGSWGVFLLPQQMDFTNANRLYGIGGTYRYKSWER